MKPGDKVFCPRCGAHYVTAIANVTTSDPPSPRQFVYADGTSTRDTDEIRCRACGEPMFEEISRQIVKGSP